MNWTRAKRPERLKNGKHKVSIRLFQPVSRPLFRICLKYSSHLFRFFGECHRWKTRGVVFENSRSLLTDFGIEITPWVRITIGNDSACPLGPFWRRQTQGNSLLKRRGFRIILKLNIISVWNALDPLGTISPLISGDGSKEERDK